MPKIHRGIKKSKNDEELLKFENDEKLKEFDERELKRFNELLKFYKSFYSYENKTKEEWIRDALNYINTEEGKLAYYYISQGSDPFEMLQKGYEEKERKKKLDDFLKQFVQEKNINKDKDKEFEIENFLINANKDLEEFNSLANLSSRHQSLDFFRSFQNDILKTLKKHNVKPTDTHILDAANMLLNKAEIIVKPFCGIGRVPKGRHRGSMNECAQKKRVGLYGIYKLDDDLVKVALGKRKMPEKGGLIKNLKVNSVLGKKIAGSGLKEDKDIGYNIGLENFAEEIMDSPAYHGEELLKEMKDEHPYFFKDLMKYIEPRNKKIYNKYKQYL